MFRRAGDGSNPDEEEEEEEQDEGPFPVWKGMSAFEAGEADPPSAGVIVVDPFCDYLGKRCIDILEGAGYAVVQARSAGCIRFLPTTDKEFVLMKDVSEPRVS